MLFLIFILFFLVLSMQEAQTNPKGSSLSTAAVVLNPELQYERFKNKYTKQGSKLLTTYLQMISNNEKEYFPPQQIPAETIQTLAAQPIFSARVIFLNLLFCEDNHPIVKAVCNAEHRTYGHYSKLKGEYQQRYLVDIGFMRKCEVGFKLGEECRYENYKFYAGQRIDRLHATKGNYKFLQDKHDYIQWMFPNHYQSLFNSHSFPMSYLQVKLFRQSDELGEKLLESIRIFFDFMGLAIHRDLCMEVISESRLRECLLVNSHNHLRLRRILACLSITGFRAIALRLIQFLRTVMEKMPGYHRLKWVFERQWEVYGDKNKKQALKLCFHPNEDFPDHHAMLLKHFDLNASEKGIILPTVISQGAKLQNFDSSSSQQQQQSVISKVKSQNPPIISKAESQQQSQSQPIEPEESSLSYQSPI